MLAVTNLQNSLYPTESRFLRLAQAFGRRVDEFTRGVVRCLAPVGERICELKVSLGPAVRTIMKMLASLDRSSATTNRVVPTRWIESQPLEPAAGVDAITRFYAAHVRFDQDREYAYWGRDRIPICRGEMFRMLRAVVRARGNPVAYEVLFAVLTGDGPPWDYKAPDKLRTLAHRINKKLESLGLSIRVEAKRGVGYMLVAISSANRLRWPVALKILSLIFSSSHPHFGRGGAARH